MNYLLPINEPATLNWILPLLSEKQKQKVFSQKTNCNKSGNKINLQSPVSRIWLERWKRRKTQELQRGAVA